MSVIIGHTPKWTKELIATIVIAVLSLALSAFASYTTNDKETNSRVVKIETRQEDDAHRLDRIENKLDRIFEVLTGHKP